MKFHASPKPSAAKALAILSAATLACVAPSSAAATIFIDFGTSSSPAQPGFTAQTAASANYATDAGQITVATTGSFFNRSATNGYTDDDLLGDFNYLNGFGTLQLTIDGLGIDASTGYELQFWSLDTQHGGGGATVTYTGVSGTTGGTSIAYSTGNTTLENSSTTTFTSNGSGEIVIDVTGTSEGPRISGMAITVIPEPSTALLGGFGALLLLRRRRTA